MKVYIENLKKNILILILLIGNLTFIIKSQDSTSDNYDPCAYVGTSNEKQLADFCLKTDINCCYFAFEWKNPSSIINQNYVYYSCINKKRLVESTGIKNLTSAFLFDVSDDSYVILNSALYVNCTNLDGVITTKAGILPPSMDTSQRLLMDNFNKTKLNSTSEEY